MANIEYAIYVTLLAKRTVRHIFCHIINMIISFLADADHCL